MKKPAEPAQIQPKSQFLFHKNLPPRDFSIMTLFKSKDYVFKNIMYFKSKMKLKPVHIVDMNKTIPEPEMENKKKMIGFSNFLQFWLKTSSKIILRSF